MKSKYSTRNVYPPGFTEILLRVNIINSDDLDHKRIPRHSWESYMNRICEPLTDAMIRVGANEGKNCFELYDILKEKAIVTLLELCDQYQNEVRESIIRVKNKEDCFTMENIHKFALDPLHYEFQIVSESPKLDNDYVFTVEDKAVLLNYNLFTRLQILNGVLNNVDKVDLKQSLIKILFANLYKNKNVKGDGKYYERIKDFERCSSLKNVLQILKKMQKQS